MSVFSPSKIWKETRFIKERTEDILQLLYKEQRLSPHLSGRPLYMRVVMKRLNVDLKAASDILDAAEASFAQWPHDRDLKFVDVALYLVIYDHFHMEGKIDTGVGPHFRDTVLEIVPSRL